MPDGFPHRPALLAHQLGQLRNLLGAVLPVNTFYKEKAAGLALPVGSLEEFFRDCPFTTKEELAADQRAHPPYGRNLTFPLAHYTRFHQTSGTSSAPLRWLDTEENWDWMVRNWQEVYRAAGVGPGHRVYFAFSFGPFIGFWLAFTAARKLGCLCLPGGGLGSAARLRAILENHCDVLCCTPSYAIRLAEVAAQEKISLHDSPVKRIIVAGEPGGSLPALRGRLEQLWPGARVFDHHGMTETGPVSYECPARPGLLHVLERSFLAEVTARQELVLTTLGRTGSPVLRYRTGDVVQPVYFEKEPCACGTFEMGLEGGIVGRIDEMVIVRGVNIYPTAVEEIVRAFPEIVEYEVRVDKSSSMAEMVLAIEPGVECADPPALARRVQGALQAALQLRVPVEVTPPNGLPRYEMKARRWKIQFEPPRQLS
jgi:phenylacetate-CoA ligase